MRRWASLPAWPRSTPSAPRRRFDAIITDERMPGMSGVTLICAVRAIRHDIPIVLVSGYLAATVGPRAENTGADAVLKKPLSACALATSLARVLRRQRPDVH